MALTLAQLAERIDAPLLIQLTDPNSAVQDDVKLQRALDDSAGQIDGYTFHLPEADRPPVATLDAHQVAIALYILAGNRPGVEFDSIRARHEAAIRYLESLSARAPRGIGGTAEAPEPRIGEADLAEWERVDP